MSTSWKEHFSKSLGSFEAEYSSHQGQVSPLAFALSKQFIPENEYFDWAKNIYKKAFLSSRFFVEHQPNRELFLKYSHLNIFGPECVPVAEWDDQLIVACLELPHEINGSITYLLAYPSDIQRFWSLLSATGATQVSPTKTNSTFESAPEGLSLEATKIGPTPGEFSADDLLAGMGSQSESSDELLQDDLESSENSGESESSEDEILDLGAIETDKPTSLTSPLVMTTTPTMATPLKATQETEAVVPTTNEVSAVAESQPSPPRGPAVAAPPPPPPSGMPQVTRTIGGTPREHTQIGVHTQVGKNIGINSSGTLFALDKWKKQNAKLTTDSGLFALKTLKNTFNKVMLLTFDEGGAFVRAFMWDDSLKGAKNESLTLPLSENSIFSIVAKTQKPFHGPVHPSDVNEAFFATWNNGELPDHATLVPLVFEDRVLGVLMGVGNSSLYNKDALRIAEKVAQEFVGKIAEVKVPKAA